MDKENTTIWAQFKDVNPAPLRDEHFAGAGSETGVIASLRRETRLSDESKTLTPSLCSALKCYTMKIGSPSISAQIGVDY